MIDLLLRATLLLLTAVAADLALRKAPAAVRGFVWTLALALLLLLPALQLALPGRLALLPRAALGPLVQDISRTASAGGVEAPVRAADPAAAKAPESTWRIGRPALSETAPGERPAAPGGRTGRSIDRPGVGPLGAAALAVWALGALIVVARGIASRAALGRAFARGERPDERIRRRIADLRRRLGISSPVAARLSGATPVPLVFGWRRPRLLLPASSSEWSPETVEMVLLHELAHVRRGDPGAQLLGRSAAAVYWIHPLIWLAVRRQRTEAENACDDLVLRQGKAPVVYARALLTVARGLCPRPYRPAAATIAARGPLERRIRAIVDPARRRGALRRGPALAAALLALPLLVPIASVPAAGGPGPAPPAAVDGAPAALDAPTGGAGSDCACSDEPHWRLRQRPPAVRDDLLEPLLARLEAVDGAERAGAARALADWPVAGARRALHAALGDPDLRVRAEAITALARRPDREDLPRFLEGIGDPSCRVSERAAEALAELGARSSQAALIESLGAGGCRLRAAAAGALASFHSPESVAALHRALSDEDARVRAAAAASLGVVGSGEAVDELLEVLHSGDGKARAGAVRALGGEPLGVVGHAEVVAALTAALGDDDPHVRQAAADALSEVGDATAVDALVARLAEDNKHVRQAAADALGHIGDARALAPLERLAAADPSSHVRRAAAEAIERLERR